MSLSRLFVLGVLGLIVLGGCSGPSQTSTSDGGGPSAEAEGPAPEERRTRPSVAEFETFDASAYPVEAPARTVEVTHEVPSQLMRGRADEGRKQTLEGFRVQVFSAQDQEAAQDFREQVRMWWQEVGDEAPQDLFRSEPPIVIEYSQPYYRVRMGAFAKREEAEEALEFLRKKYSGAFVARSTVTVIR